MPHELLISRLCDIGVGGCFLDILYDYLSQQKQYVRIEDHRSKQLQVTRGVPQGSLLGPLLFCIFINNIPDVLTLSQPFIFADDLKILAIGKSNEEVQTDKENCEMGKIKENETSSQQLPFAQISRDTRMSIIKRITARGAWVSGKPVSLHCVHVKLEYAQRASNRESK